MFNNLDVISKHHSKQKYLKTRICDPSSLIRTHCDPGSFVMRLVAKSLKSKHELDDDVRSELYKSVKVFIKDGLKVCRVLS